MTSNRIIKSALCFLAILALQSNVNATPFSQTIIVDEQSALALTLTGVSTRKKFFLDIYKIAHYIDTPLASSGKVRKQHIFEDLLSSPVNKQVSLVFQRPLSAEQIQKALTKGVKNNCMGDEAHRVERALSEFRNAITIDVEKNDEFSLRWTKEGKLLAFFEGKNVGKFDSPLLARLLWSMWFGDNAVVNRSDLVSQLHFANDNIE